MSKIQFIDRRGTGSVKWDAMEKQYGSSDMLSMWVADMDVACPDCVQEALKKYLATGAYGYAILSQGFHEAFLNWEQQHHGYAVQTEWLRYTPGVVSGLNWCVEAFTEPEDAVLVLTPVYYPFFSAVTNHGRTLVESELVRSNDGNYRMNLSDIEEKIREHQVKMLIFCSPHNPIGRVWTKEELTELAILCQNHQVLVVSDEIHQDFVYAPHQHIPFATIHAGKTVTLTAPSKTFNLAGLNNAVAILPDERLREKWDEFLKRVGIHDGTSFGYIAGEAAYLGGEAWLKELKSVIKENERLFRELLQKELPDLIFSKLQGTYLLWVDFGAYVDKENLQEFFEKKCRIAIDYGNWFHGASDTCVRFNLATNPQLVCQAAKTIIREIQTLNPVIVGKQ